MTSPRADLLRRARPFPGRVAALFGPDRSLLLALSGVFVVMRVYVQIGQSPTPFGDTPSYSELSFVGNATRIWGLPLFWKLVPGGPASDAAAQLLLGVIAWLVLAATVHHVCRTRAAAVGGFALVLLLGLAGQVTEWDLALISESLSLSTMLLMISAILLAAQHLTPKRAAYLAVTLCLWACTRQANVSILVVAFLPILAFLLLTRRRDVILWVAVPLIVVMVWSGFLATRDSGIWKDNATGVLQERLLVDPVAAEFFYDHGMPRTALIASQAGKDFEGGDSPLSSDVVFETWRDEHFQSVYARWLLSNPIKTIKDPIVASEPLLAARANYIKTNEALPAPVLGVLWPNPSGFPLIILLALVLGAWAARVSGSLRRVAVPVAGLVLAGIWAIMTWQQAVNEQVRLFAPLSALAHLAVVVLFVVAADELLAHRRRRGTMGDSGEQAGPLVDQPLVAR